MRPCHVPDRWEMILLSHLEYGEAYLEYGEANLQRQWVPAMTKAGIDFMQRKFREWAVVHCAGNLHRVGITKNGSMALLDHPNWRQEAERYCNFKELGGTTPLPRCLRYLMMFTPGSQVFMSDLPKGMHEYALVQIDKKRKRRWRHVDEKLDLLQFSLSERWRYNRGYAKYVSSRPPGNRTRASE